MKLNGSFCLDFKADDFLRHVHVLVYILNIHTEEPANPRGDRLTLAAEAGDKSKQEP